MATEADLAAGGASVVVSTALENSHIISKAQAVYYGCDGRNADSTTAYIFVIDATAVPANGTISSGSIKHVIAVSSGQNFAHGTGQWGELFKNGIVLVASSTDFPTLTISTSSKTFFSCDAALEYGQYVS